MSPFKEDPNVLEAPDRGDLFTSTDIPPNVPAAGPRQEPSSALNNIPWGLVLAGIAAAYLLLR